MVFPSITSCLQIPGSSDKRVLSMDVLKVVMEQLNKMYLIQCLYKYIHKEASRLGVNLYEEHKRFWILYHTKGFAYV